jgi:hypothetical protein
LKEKNLFEDHYEKSKSEKIFSHSQFSDSYRFNSPHSFTRAHKKTKNTRRERGVTNSLSFSLSLSRSRFVRGRRPERDRERDGGQKTKREREEQIKEFFFFIYIPSFFLSSLSSQNLSSKNRKKSFSLSLSLSLCLLLSFETMRTTKITTMGGLAVPNNARRARSRMSRSKKERLRCAKVVV